MDTNIVNMKNVSVWWCLYVLSNTKATFEAQFTKKFSNTKAELKKSVAYKKSVLINLFTEAYLGTVKHLWLNFL